MKKNRLRRISPNASKRRKIKRNDEKELWWATYGLKKPPKPRFKGLAGVLWYVLSRYVRKSEFITYQGMCVDGCGRKVLAWEEADCGHFRASNRGFCTRFLRENLGLQTKYCNNPMFSPDSAYGFGLTIDQRYGVGTAQRLKLMSNTVCKEYSPQKYDTEIRKYIKLFEEL